ncbi:hypothetical protein HDU96_008773, partial [Phlyctochytrium bullatum]
RPQSPKERARLPAIGSKLGPPNTFSASRIHDSATRAARRKKRIAASGLATPSSLPTCPTLPSTPPAKIWKTPASAKLIHPDVPLPNREPAASLISRLSFSWTSPLIRRGRHAPHTLASVPDLATHNRAEKVVADFHRFAGRFTTHPLRVLRTFPAQILLFELRGFLYQVLVATFMNFCGLAMPYLLYRITKFIESGEAGGAWVSVGYAGLLGGTALVRAVCEQQLWHTGMHMGLRVRAIVIDAVYTKALRRVPVNTPSVESKDADVTPAAASTGQIVTLLSTDAESIREAVWDLFYLVTLPPQIILSASNRALDTLLSLTDRRTTLLNEALHAICLVKLFGWESRFRSRLRAARNEETIALRSWFVVEAAAWVLWDAVPLAVSLATFAVYAVMGSGTLDAGSAFAAIALFNWLRLPLAMAPHALMMAFGLSVSLRRVDAFLRQPELEHKEAADGEEVLGFRDASFAWHVLSDETDGMAAETTPLLQDSPTASATTFTLRNLFVVFPPGGLTVVAGPTGSGKTALLLSLLGETHLLSGTLHAPPPASIAYVSQTPWLLAATIRDNICFGRPYDPARYSRCIEACTLAADLAEFDAGDLTEIGKQRVALARACYADAPVVLMDDPLSAMDAPTARHLVTMAVCGLLEARTRVLVTHAVDLVARAADWVVVMRDGAVAAHGRPKEVEGFFEGSQAAADAKPNPDETEIAPHPYHSLRENSSSTDFANGRTREDAQKLVTDEDSQTGAVKLAVHATYLHAAGAAIFLAFFWGCLGVERVVQAAESFWIKQWVEANTGTAAADGESDQQRVDVWMFVGVYALIAVAWMVGSTTTFAGRILNRATKDIATIDRNVMTSYHHFFALLSNLIAITALVTYITPFFFVAFLPYVVAYYGFARDFLASSRELKRLDSVTRSPIYSIFSETLVGASTIRAYNAALRFRNETLRRINANHRAYFHLWCTNRWLGTRVATIGALIVFTAAAVTVLARDRIGAGLAAISLIWSLNFSDFLIWIVREHAELEMSLNAVERVGEYLEVEQEKEGGMMPPKEWPSEGAISVKILELRYSPESDPVLKDVSFIIPGGSKVGIVGRTGAGKSSLTLALFRIVEPTGGTITIDGIDVSQIALHDLRSRLTIIPQDPVLFAGNLRTNMDPFSEHSDELIWSCIKRVHILETMQGAAEGGGLTLDTVVAEGGSNFSQGQRQLLCLARALLKSSKVAVLDEATASVDKETDARIQETIRGPEFENVTVLAIAHRLSTVADYDLILVLDKGKVVQFGSPYELIQQGGGIFRGMCEESGELEELEAIARNASQKLKSKPPPY